MHDARAIPQDLESCQRQLQEAWALHAELSETCTTLQCGEEKLRQENEELQATIKPLLRQRYSFGARGRWDRSSLREHQGMPKSMGPLDARVGRAEVNATRRLWHSFGLASVVEKSKYRGGRMTEDQAPIHFGLAFEPASPAWVWRPVPCRH